jgi:hypothetical protein
LRAPRLPGEPRASRSSRRLESPLGLAVVTLVGLAARVLFLLLEPRIDLRGDEPSWTSLALFGLLKIKRPFSPYRSHILFYPPAYPYFIAAAYAVFSSLSAVKWLQVAVGSLIVTAVGRVGRFAASARAGLLAAGFAAVYPDLIWFSVHFWSETLFLFFLWWGFERIFASDVSGRGGAALGGGVFWGLACLTRETPLLFAPVPALFLARGERPGGTRRAALFLLGVFLTVAPWTYRNWVVFHAFVPVSTFGALNLWQGNSLRPRDEVFRDSDSVESPVAQYHLAWKRGLEVIAERQPYWILEKLRSEMPQFWSAESHPLIQLESGAYGTLRPGVLWLARLAAVLPYLVVLALFAFGAAASKTPSRALLLLFLAYYNAIHVVVFASTRFRLPILPVLFVVGASFFARSKEDSLSGGRRTLAWVLVLVLALLVILGGL